MAHGDHHSKTQLLLLIYALSTYCVSGCCGVEADSLCPLTGDGTRYGKRSSWATGLPDSARSLVVASAHRLGESDMIPGSCICDSGGLSPSAGHRKQSSKQTHKGDVPSASGRGYWAGPIGPGSPTGQLAHCQVTQSAQSTQGEADQKSRIKQNGNTVLFQTGCLLSLLPP